MARLGTRVHRGTPVSWSRAMNIISPLKILRELGVDIFSDESYDTWVLQTMRYRAVNNSRTHGGPQSETRQFVINPLFFFFNHNCEGNTYDRAEISPAAPETSRAVKIAMKDIKKGEDVCTNYLGPMSDFLSRETRQERLKRGGWFGSKGCQCPRCLSG